MITFNISETPTHHMAFAYINNQTGNIIYVGWCHMNEFRLLNDNRLFGMGADSVTLFVVAFTENETDAKTKAFDYAHARGGEGVVNDLLLRLNPSKISDRRLCPVKCVTTGKIWNSISECCRERGISPSNLSNHLKKVSGFRSVGGHQYERV